MNKVLIFQESERHSLRSGIHLPSRNINAVHFGTDTISSLEPKLRKLLPDKIKHALALSVFKSKIKSWAISNCSCRLCKLLVKDLGFLKIFYTVQPILHRKKLYIQKSLFKVYIYKKVYLPGL